MNDEIEGQVLIESGREFQRELAEGAKEERLAEDLEKEMRRLDGW